MGKGKTMYKYILKRILWMIPIVFSVVFIVHFILYITPMDATVTILGNEWTEETAAELREELGLDDPFLVQYVRYVGNVLRGDLGRSYVNGTPIIDQIKARFMNTVYLMLGAMLIATVFSIPIGVISATKPNSFFSAITTAFTLIGKSMPTFWLGLMLMLLFSVKLDLLPSTGADSFANFILPSVTLGMAYMASFMRTTRSSMLEAIRQDYIRTAKAKGVHRREVIYKHALKNAILPTITVIGNSMGILMGGAVVQETVFSIPGMGRLMIESIQKRDNPGVLGAILSMAVCIAIISLLVDIIYAYVDPRIKAQYISGRRE